MRDEKTYHFQQSKIGLGILTGELSINGQNVRVCVLHLDRIGPVKKRGQAIEMSWKSALGFLKTELLEETVRSRSVDELIAWLNRGESGNIIIGGDFNTVPFSKAIRKMNQTYDDALWPSWRYLTSSYQKFPLPITPRIDYVFHSPGIKCNGSEIIKEGPGDHYPVKAVFSVLSM